MELKWNKTADTALQQIKDRKYPQSLEPYTGNILLVGINYDKKTKEHSCVIEMIKAISVKLRLFAELKQIPQQN